MKLLLLLTCFLSLALVGCHKKDAPQPQTPQAAGDTTAAPDPAKLPPPTAAVAARADNAPRDNVDGEVNAFLTAQLRTFVQKQGRMPGSFMEFKNAALDSVPQPPAGKKWVIDRAAVSVKAVAQ